MSKTYDDFSCFIGCNVEVDRKNEESDASLIERFKKQVRKSGILEEYKKRSFFTKPSKKRRVAREKEKEKAKNG